MIANSPLVYALVGLFAIEAVNLALVYRDSQARNRDWRLLAARTGLSHTSGHFFATRWLRSPRVSGRYCERSLTLGVLSGGRFRLGRLVATITLTVANPLTTQRPGGVSLHIRRNRRPRHLLKRRFPAASHRNFQQAFTYRSWPDNLGVHVLRSPNVRQLLADPAFLELKLDRQQLSFQKLGVGDSVADLERRFQALCAVAAEIERFTRVWLK